MGNERMTGALQDRLTHRVHILEANGESYRLRQARKRTAPSQRTIIPRGWSGVPIDRGGGDEETTSRTLRPRPAAPPTCPPWIDPV